MTALEPVSGCQENYKLKASSFYHFQTYKPELPYHINKRLPMKLKVIFLLHTDDYKQDSRLLFKF